MFYSMKRVAITPEALTTAILIWLRLAPKRIWRKSEEHERLKAEKRHVPENAPDPHRELAQYLTGRFQQADWEVTHPEAKNHG